MGPDSVPTEPSTMVDFGPEGTGDGATGAPLLPGRGATGTGAAGADGVAGAGPAAVREACAAP